MRAECGAVLLEVIVALAILSTLGVLALTGATDSALAVQRAREREAAISDASRFMESVALWPREDLDQRLGRRDQGPYFMITNRPSRNLYLVTLVHRSTGERLIETALFRPEDLGDRS